MVFVFDLHSDCHLLLGFGQLETKRKDRSPFCCRAGLSPHLLSALPGIEAQCPCWALPAGRRELRPQGAMPGRAGSTSVLGWGGMVEVLRWHWGSRMTM